MSPRCKAAESAEAAKREAKTRQRRSRRDRAPVPETEEVQAQKRRQTCSRSCCSTVRAPEESMRTCGYNEACRYAIGGGNGSLVADPPRHTPYTCCLRPQQPSLSLRPCVLCSSLPAPSRAASPGTAIASPGRVKLLHRGPRSGRGPCITTDPALPRAQQICPPTTLPPTRDRLPRPSGGQSASVHADTAGRGPGSTGTRRAVHVGLLGADAAGHGPRAEPLQ